MADASDRLFALGVDERLSGKLAVSRDMAGSMAITLRQDCAMDLDVLAFLSRLDAAGEKPAITLADPRDLARASINEAPVDTTEQQQAARAIMADAARMNASDIHLVSTQRQGLRVFFRINGDLVERVPSAGSYAQGIRLVRTIYNAMTTDSAQSFRVDDRLDARIGARHFLPEGVESIRVSSIGLNHNDHSMVLRLLYERAAHDVDFLSLGYDAGQVAMLDAIARRPQGCCIISGPTGSGKSTTLAALLNRVIAMSHFTKNVLTVEDPCEYPIEGARQSSVVTDATPQARRLAYSAAITAAMRHDPDVIMIGEIRDEASAMLAFSGAKTGHFLPASLHANNAMAIASRLMDLGVKEQDVFDPTLLVAMISQRLVKRLCTHCRLEAHAAFAAGDDRWREWAASLGSLEGVYVRGPGCGNCRDGIASRTVVAEIMLPDENLMALIRSGRRIEAMAYWKEALSGMTMMDHAIAKIRAGLLDPADVAASLGALPCQGEAHDA